MSHFGVLSYKGTGHLNPLIALSRELLARGHKVTFFQRPELEQLVRPHGLEFSPIGTCGNSYGEGAAKDKQRVSSGTTAFRSGIRRIAGDMEMFLREAPAALVRAGIDTLIMDEIALSGPTLAEMLAVPYFVVSTSVPHNFGWPEARRMGRRNSRLSRLQTALLQVSILRMRGPVRRRLDRFRQQAGLGPIRRIGEVYPELAHLTQLPQCIDFPRRALPWNFHYAGPFVDQAARPTVEFPWSRLDGRPIVYASLGTGQKINVAIFRLIAEACTKCNVQLVISLGDRRSPEMLDGLPGNPVVVRYAPQLELLKKSEIVITHGGLNTALETLLEGKPMIVIPKAFDQPAVAARLRWLGVAEVLTREDLSVQRLHSTLSKVLNEPRYRSAAGEVQIKIRSARGLERAADLIEGALEAYATNGSRSCPAYTRSSNGRIRAAWGNSLRSMQTDLSFCE
jgi:zeaxanthin glucosyltransferase